MATTFNFTLQLLFNKDVPDYFGTWEYAAATGVDQALQLTVQLIATKRTHTFGGSGFPASMLTATVMFPAAAGAVPPNLTLQGVHDFATNNESGSVSAASAELADQIGGTFTFIGGMLTILPPGVSAAGPAKVPVAG
jgi:hypothetical protein